MNAFNLITSMLNLFLAMKNEFRSIIYIGFVVFFSFCFFSAKSQDFEVAPVILSYDADPGGIQTKKMTIRNHDALKQSFEFQLGDYELDDKGKKKRLPAGESKHSVADMITINPALVELNPNEEVTVDVILTVPKSIEGSRWGMIYVQAAKEQTENALDKTLATGVVLKPRIVVLVSQVPKSSTNYMASIDRLKEITKEGDKSRSFSAVVSNTGDNPIKARVHLVLANIATAEETEFDPTEVTVLPDGEREVVLRLPKNIDPGKYALGAILDYGHRSVLEGAQIMIEQQ